MSKDMVVKFGRTAGGNRGMSPVGYFIRVDESGRARLFTTLILDADASAAAADARRLATQLNLAADSLELHAGLELDTWSKTVPVPDSSAEEVPELPPLKDGDCVVVANTKNPSSAFRGWTGVVTEATDAGRKVRVDLYRFGGVVFDRSELKKV